MVVLKELSNMFWGLTINGGRRYSQTVDRPFHVSMAALEFNPQGPDKASHVQVMLQQGTSQFLLCTLGPGKHLQQQLDLHFSSGETVEFFLAGKGDGVVHLTGSLMEEEHDFADDFGEDEYDTDSDGAPELVTVGDLDSEDEDDDDWKPVEEPAGSKRKASNALRSNGKKMKITELNEDEDDDEDDDYDSSFIDDEVEVDEEEDEDESVEDEEDDAVSDSLMDVLTTKPPKSEKKASDLDTSSEKSPSKKKKNKKEQKNKDQQVKGGPSPAGDAFDGDATAAKKKKKKKKKKKNQEEGGSQPEQSPSADQAPQSPTTKSSPAVGKKRSVAGGTSVEDIKIGHGPEAKPGKTVSVYYSGVLAKSNKRFDSCLKGKPFRFRLGRGEVIKGWDTGLIGMKVGGKRKIVVPPSQGYGNARQGPIPPGSTLTFDVEMKAVS